MISQIFMAKSAMFAMQRKLQTCANNISNSQTVAYKSQRVELESLFPLVLERAISEFEDDSFSINKKRKKYIEYGQGVRIVSTTRNHTNGTIEVTNRTFDHALQGKGFFRFRLPNGEYAYSRAGNFHLDREGNLVNQNGHPLEPPVRVPRNALETIVNEEGRVFIRTDASPIPAQTGQVMLAMFPNEEKVRDIGQNLYVETLGSGTPIMTVPGKNGAATVLQRSLEFSNVDVMEQMMQMLMTQRAFELVVKSISAADSMLKVASDLK